MVGFLQGLTQRATWGGDVHFRRGYEHFVRREFAEAVEAFGEALQIDPDDLCAKWNRSLSLLSMNDYERGLPEHEVAWSLFDWRGYGPVRDDIDRLKRDLPHWKGERGGRLLVYHELGYGDGIMALRYLPQVMARCDVVLVVDQCLVRLAEEFGCKVRTWIPEDLSRFDYRVPLFGVLAALGERAETVPGEPYIKREWRGGGGRIGIVWSGRTQSEFKCETFLSRLDLNGSVWSLQPGPVPAGVEALPPGDFADLARRIAQMDTVISVDTAAVHLAGAMGHPNTHLILPFMTDWRWWNAARWYPSVKVHRQEMAGDWRGPFASVNAEMKKARG